MKTSKSFSLYMTASRSVSVAQTWGFFQYRSYI